MMGQLQLIITTHGRKDQQLTVQNLPKELMSRTTLVCPKREYGYLRDMRNDYDVVVQPDPDWYLNKKREWVIEEWVRRGHDKIVLLDDDLRFATRKSKDDWHLRPIAGKELIDEFQRMEDKLGPEFPHVGFAQRQGNNTIKEAGWKIPGKQVCMMGYYLPVVAKEVRWDQLTLRTDMWATLQLLLKGYPNAVWTETVHDQRAFDAPGGCQRYRTVELLNSEAEKFASMYPGYVSITNRQYKEQTKESDTRLEVIVQWQKALEDGKHARNQRGECA
jgi:hypothetical protein